MALNPQNMEMILKSLMTNVHEGVVIVDREGDVVSWNGKANDILNIEGYGNKKVSIHKLIPSLGKLVDKLQTQHTINGDDIWVSIYAINENLEGTGFILLLNNLTSHRGTELMLKSTKEKVDLAIAALGFHTWEIDLDENTLTSDGNAFSLLGYAPKKDPLPLADFERLVHPDDMENRSRALQGIQQGGNKEYECEYRVKNSRGEYVWIYSYGRVAKEGELVGKNRIVGVAFNISKQKQYEEKLNKKNQELIKANNEKDKFFSIIAHDLRGPFQGFIGLTEFMSEHHAKLSSDETLEIAQALQTTAKNLYELLENLLSWALIKRGHKRFNPGRAYLNSLVQSVSDLFIPQLSVKQVVLINHISDDLVALADQESLRTILRNLISNAIKFTPKNGTVTLDAVKREDGFLLISVKDTGIGMPPEIRDNLFSITQKVSRPGTENEPSTGLGLILSKELVEKHGGEIWTASEENKGSTFYFTIPSQS